MHLFRVGGEQGRNEGEMEQWFEESAAETSDGRVLFIRTTVGPFRALSFRRSRANSRSASLRISEAHRGCARVAASITPDRMSGDAALRFFDYAQRRAWRCARVAHRPGELLDAHARRPPAGHAESEGRNRSGSDPDQ
jgi:hypothetical protein